MKNKFLGLSFLFFCIASSLSAQQLKEGQKAPDFKLYALDGTSSSLDTYQGKVVVIKMWFTTCAPCIQEIPKVNKLVESYKNRNDIVFLAPSPNNKSVLEKFTAKVNLKYTTMSSSYEMLRVYNPFRRYPSHVIIDKKGVISFVLEGTSNNIDELLATEINKVL